MIKQVDMLVKALLEHKPDIPSKMYPSAADYVLSHGTIDLALPRQIGKTTYIANNAKCGDLILTHNYMMAERYKKVHWVQAHSVELYTHTPRGTRRDWHPRTIWLDEVDISTHAVKQMLYNMIVSTSQRIVSLRSSILRKP